MSPTRELFGAQGRDRRTQEEDDLLDVRVRPEPTKQSTADLVDSAADARAGIEPGKLTLADVGAGASSFAEVMAWARSAGGVGLDALEAALADLRPAPVPRARRGDGHSASVRLVVSDAIAARAVFAVLAERGAPWAVGEQLAASLPANVAGPALGVPAANANAAAPRARSPFTTVTERVGAAIYRDAYGDAGSDEHPLVRDALARRGGGQPLPAGLRATMEARFGTGFDRVRIHTDRAAAEACRAISAHAFTIGEDIFFGDGRSAADATLLAHELTHVVQAQQGRTGGGGVSRPDDALEHEAREIASLAEDWQRPAGRAPEGQTTLLSANRIGVHPRGEQPTTSMTRMLRDPDPAAPAADTAAPTLKWATAATAPGAGDTRFTLGPGESVTFTGSKEGTWTASGGEPTTGGAGATFTWKAPSAVGIYTIKLTVDGKDVTQGMSVLAPTSIQFTKTAQQNADAGQAGVGMTLEMKIGPDNASFSEIQIQEQPGGAASASGTFAKMPNAHTPNAQWTNIGNANKATQDDDAFAGPFDLPVEVGALVWNVPYLWQTGGGGGGSFAIINQTMSIVDSKGTMTIVKGGASATWTPLPAPKKPDAKAADGAAADGAAADGAAADGAGVRRKASGAPLDADARARLAEARSGSGQPLPDELRIRFEESLGVDLSDVRVHTGSAAATAAWALGANAFAHGRDIFFGDGRYAPDSADGQRLLAHEVAHTVQSGPAAGDPLVSDPGDAVEHDADAAADRMVDGGAAEVRPSAAGLIGRDGEPRTDLAADMLDVTQFDQTAGGATTASPSESDPELRAGEVLIKAGRISFNAAVALKAAITIGPHQEILVGPTQTLMGSQRTGIYRNPDGSVAAEFTTGPASQMRDAGASQRSDGRPVPEPFYWEPRPVTDDARNASIPFADQPQFVIPGTMGRAVLSETRGQDAFRTALSAKRGGTLIHLRTLEWTAPWDMQIPASRSATGAAQSGASTTGPDAAPPTLSGPIPNDASHEWMRFTDVATARAAGWQTLVRYIGDARTQDRNAYQIMAEALVALNPTFTVGARCDAEYSSVGSDAVTLTAIGTSSTQSMSNVRRGGNASLRFRMFEVLSIDSIDSHSRVTLGVTVSGVVSSMTGSVPWLFPWATSSEVSIPFDDRANRNAYKLSGSVSEGGEAAAAPAVPPSTGGGGGPDAGVPDGGGGAGGAGGVDRWSAGDAIAPDAAQRVSAAHESAGAPLPSELRRRFEASTGSELSAVRVHTGAESQAAARSVAARAYAVGQDIHFAAGEYDPSTEDGQRLIAHEVAHTVQQGAGSPSRQHKLEVSSVGDAAELEADRAATAMVSGTPATIGGAGAVVARDPNPAAPAAGTGAGPGNPPDRYKTLDPRVRDLLWRSKDDYMKDYAGNDFWEKLDNLGVAGLQTAVQTLKGAEKAGFLGCIQRIKSLYTYSGSWGIDFFGTAPPVGAPGWGLDLQYFVRKEHGDKGTDLHNWYRQNSGAGNPGLHCGVAAGSDYHNLHTDPTNPMEFVGQGLTSPVGWTTSFPPMPIVAPQGQAIYSASALIEHWQDIGKLPAWGKAKLHPAANQPFLDISLLQQFVDKSTLYATFEENAMADVHDQGRARGAIGALRAASKTAKDLNESSRAIAMQDNEGNQPAVAALQAQCDAAKSAMFRSLASFFAHLHHEVPEIDVHGNDAESAWTIDPNHLHGTYGTVTSIQEKRAVDNKKKDGGYSDPPIDGGIPGGAP